MKALTISQPYASLIASGEKWIENRTWYTPYRGPLAIHAGKGTQYMTRKQLADVPHGCVLATAELAECVELRKVIEFCKGGHQLSHESRNRTGRSWDEILKHPHAEGPWLWVLRDVVALPEPVPYKGAQGIWNWHRNKENHNDTT